MDADVVVVGAGAVGLACAAELSRAGLSVVVAERHASPGQETSSRNSQVLHAGIYYPAGSSKADLCVRGNRSLSTFCEAHGVPFRRIGKWLLAVEPEEEARLAEVVSGGRANGVSLEEVPISRFNAEEPHVRAVAAVLSPSTGILDVHGLFRALRVLAEENGASFAMRHTLVSAAPVRGGYELLFSDPSGEEARVTASCVVNAAGLDADTVAAMPGLDVEAAEYRLSWTKGSYFRIRGGKRHLARRLLYPVLPSGLGSILGIHLTVDLDGELKLGPDIEVLAERRQDYAVDEGRRDSFLAAARRYLPSLEPDDLSPDQSGIRARLQAIGAPFRDFVVAEESERGLPGWVNLVGIESPGLTCCLEIAREVRSLLPSGRPARVSEAPRRASGPDCGGTMTSAPGISPDVETLPPERGRVVPADGERSVRACPLSAILGASPDPAFLTTANGTVVAVNEAFASAWGRGAAGSCEGENLSTLLADGAAELLDGVAGGQVFSCDGRAVLSDGAEIELRLSARRLPNPESSEERLVVFASDVTAARRLERAAAVLGASLDTPGGEGLFVRLVEGLSRTLRMEMAIVGRLEEEEPGNVRTLAVWSDGAVAEPFIYDLHGAPCEQVIGRVPCVFPSRVAELFPEDLLLSGSGLSSYVGVPLTSAGGSPLGLLAALSRRPLHDGDSAVRALGLFAGRAAAEIERREAREEEHHREEESRRLVASIPVGLHRYRLEDDGRLVFAGANPAADAILGVDNRQFVGKTIEEAFPGLVGTDVPDAYRRAASEGLPWRSESVTYSDGRIAGAFLVQAFQTGPGEVVASFFDITARRRTEEALREREGRLERLNRILRTITHVQEIVSEARETGELLGRVCSTLVADRDYVFAWVGLLDETGNEVSFAAASGPCDPARFRIDLKTLHGGPACGKAAFLRGAAVLVDEGAGGLGCPECPTLAEHPEGSALALPLWKGERALGVLVVHAPRRGVFGAEESKLIEQLADGIATAIDGIDAETQRARARREKTFRADVVAASFREETESGLLEALARSVRERYEAAGALVALWDENHGRLSLARGCGLLTETASSPALAGEVAALLGGAGAPDRDRSFASRLDLGAEVIAWPLTDGGHPLGILAIAPGRGGEGFAAGVDAANQLSLALSKARLFEVNSERVATLLALHETGVDLGSNLERDVLLRAIIDRAQSLVHGTMAGLYLVREDGVLALALANGVLANYVGVALPPGEGVAGTVAKTRTPLLLVDYRAWPGRSPVFATIAGIASVIGVPVLWRGAVLGSLFVNHEVPGRFGASDVETVRLFAEQAAVAIANARLIGDLKGAAEELALAYDATLEGWVHALDLRDKETEEHTHRVVDRTVDLARRAGVAEETLVHVRRGALLHDIGKMGIPDRILQKPGPLTEEEWSIMRLHPTYAHEMLGGIAFLRPALDIPFSHHEKWDGTGYPRGLRGEQIPIAARVFAVVDIWDALISDRPYRKAVPASQVRDYLRTIAGTHLESRLVDLFLSTGPE